MRKGIFVTATDTGVGKTITAALISFALRKRGIDCVIMKPVETGAIKRGKKWIHPDAEFLQKINQPKEEEDLISPCRFKNPLAPSLAARMEGKEVDIGRIKRAFNKLSGRHQMVIVEGAGGLLVPLKKDFLIADLIRELDLPVIIVSRLGLGTINHTLLTIKAAQNYGLETLGIVFNQNNNTKTAICEKSNPSIISGISGVPVLGAIPYLKGISVENGRIKNLEKATGCIRVDLLIRDSGITTKKLQEDDKKYVWHPFTQMQDWSKDSPLVIDEGRGSYIRDTDGKWYLDGISSLWVNLHGHRKKELDRAVRKQLNKISHSTLLGLSNVPSVELASRLIAIAPGKLSKVFYSDSGSTAVEIALKMAYQYWQQESRATKKKTKFIRFVNAYHGDTIGAVSVGGIDLFHQIYYPLLFKSFKVNSPYCYRCHMGLTYPRCRLKCLEDTEKIIKKHHREIAALIIEPVIYAAAGMLTQPQGFLQGVERLCRKYKVLLICDEVATGFGRTGKMFACEKDNIKPDILCLAKAITAGYLPLAATLTTQEIFNAFLGEYKDKKTFFHGHTYTGNPLACSVALTSLNILRKERVLQRLAPKIAYLKSKLKQFSALTRVGDIRQCGFMVGIELVKNKKSRLVYKWEEKIGIRVCQEARKHGVILRPLGNVIVLMPPLSISLAELNKLLEVTYFSVKSVTEDENQN